VGTVQYAGKLPATVCTESSGQGLYVIMYKFTSFTKKFHKQLFAMDEEVGVMLCSDLFQYILSCWYSVR